MGETRKPRSLDQLRVTMNKVGADVLEKRITRRQYNVVFAQVEAELAAQGLTFLDLLDWRHESPGGGGEAVGRRPREGTRLSG